MLFGTDSPAPAHTHVRLPAVLDGRCCAAEGLIGLGLLEVTTVSSATSDTPTARSAAVGSTPGDRRMHAWLGFRLTKMHACMTELCADVRCYKTASGTSFTASQHRDTKTASGTTKLHCITTQAALATSAKQCCFLPHLPLGTLTAAMPEPWW